MTTKHTAGPWFCVTGSYVQSASMPDGLQAAVINYGVIAQGQESSDAPANARLIAAAPDLLRVVESVFLWDLSKDIGKGKRKPSPLYPSIIEAAREALKKAGV